MDKRRFELRVLEYGQALIYRGLEYGVLKDKNIFHEMFIHNMSLTTMYCLSYI